MMRRHTKVLRRLDEDGDRRQHRYRPRHLRDSRNTRNDLDRRDQQDAEPDGDDPPGEP